MSTSSRPPLTDSPWFWLYVFATAGVLSLVLIGPKFGARQSQLDRQFEGRRHITQLPADVPGQRPYSSPSAREQSLRPLYTILTVAVLGGWMLLWWQRYSASSAARGNASGISHAASDENALSSDNVLSGENVLSSDNVLSGENAASGGAEQGGAASSDPANREPA